MPHHAKPGAVSAKHIPLCTTTPLRAKLLNLSNNPLRIQSAQRQQFLSGALLDKAVRQTDIQHRHQDVLRLPVVLTRTEVREVLARMKGVYGLMANMLYGTGMRLMECVRLRVKDVDFERNRIPIRNGGVKFRIYLRRCII